MYGMRLVHVKHCRAPALTQLPRQDHNQCSLVRAFGDIMVLLRVCNVVVELP